MPHLFPQYIPLTFITSALCLAMVQTRAQAAKLRQILSPLTMSSIPQPKLSKLSSNRAPLPPSKKSKTVKKPTLMPRDPRKETILVKRTFLHSPYLHARLPAFRPYLQHARRSGSRLKTPGLVDSSPSFTLSRRSVQYVQDPQSSQPQNQNYHHTSPPHESRSNKSRSPSPMTTESPSNYSEQSPTPERSPSVPLTLSHPDSFPHQRVLRPRLQLVSGPIREQTMSTSRYRTLMAGRGPHVGSRLCLPMTRT